MPGWLSDTGRYSPPSRTEGRSRGPAKAADSSPYATEDCYQNSGKQPPTQPLDWPAGIVGDQRERGPGRD